MAEPQTGRAIKTALLAPGQPAFLLTWIVLLSAALFACRMGQPPPGQKQPTVQEGSRTVNFGGGRPVGFLICGPAGTNIWGIREIGKDLGLATGVVTLPIDWELYLRVTQSARNLACLSNLKPDDLQCLSLRRSAIKNDSLRMITHLTGLKYLDLEETAIDDDALRYLEPLKNLGAVEFMDAPISDEGLKHFSDLPKLNALYLRKTQVRGPGLAYLEGLPRLSVLDLSGPTTTDATIRHAIRLKRLVSLELYSSSITDGGLVALKNCQLSRLGLHFTGITGRGLTYLTENESLRDLDLRNTRFSDRYVPLLIQLTSLVELRLAGTNLTDTGALKLQALKRLNRLVLPDHISSKTVDALQKALPGCTITQGE